MRVMVTGGSGLLGHFVVEALRLRHQVTVLDLDVPTSPSIDVTYHCIDVLDLPALHRFIPGHQAVIHLAAIDAGNPYPDETYFRTNVVGTWNVLQAAHEAGVAQVVIASSSSVYGLEAHTAPDYLPVDEAHAKRPTGVYGLSKVLMETTAASFARHARMRVLCLRPTHIVRPQTEAAILLQLAIDDGDATTLTQLKRRVRVAPYGALPALRGYVRSRDAARAFVLALDHDTRNFDVFNVCAGDSMGRVSTRQRMRKLYEREPMLRNVEPSWPAANESVFDSRRAREVLGWSASGDWRDLEDEYR